MPTLDPESLQRYRNATFRLTPDRRLRNPADALDFVNERGFVYFWPIKGVTLPSLWAAVAGDRPVADEHDDPGHITWRWKDESLDKRIWHYAKVLRGCATLIALDLVPTFYALSENYGEPEQDYLIQYQDGLLSHEAKLIYEKLLADGPLDTVTLRRETRMTSKASNYPFERALTHLQRNFNILPVGVAQTGSWRYSFIYECVHRWRPDLPALARAISRRSARAKLVERHLQSVGAATAADVRKLFQWPKREVEQALEDVTASGKVARGFEMKGERGEWFVCVIFCSR
jgi:hypothetical protein